MKTQADKTMRYCTINLQNPTYLRLKALGHYGETRSQLIDRLIAAYEEYLHLKEELCLREYVPTDQPPSP